MIKKKWYVFALVSIIVALFCMVMFNYTALSSNITQSIEDVGSSNLAQAKEELQAYLENGKSVVQTTAVSVEYMVDAGATAEDIKQFLVYESKRYMEEIDENFSGIYGLFDGTYIDGIGWVPDADYDPKTRDWYLVASQAKGEPAIVSPYLDAQTNTIMLSVCQMLKDGESVLSLDIKMDRIQEITEKIRLNNVGYGFVMDKSGLVIAHSDSKEKGKNYLDKNSQFIDLVNQVQKKEKSCFEINLRGETVTVFSDTVMDDWSVVMIVSNDVLFADARRALLHNIFICGAISVLIIAFFVITFIRIDQSLEREIESNQKIEEMNRKIIRALVRTIDAKDHYTNGHSLRVAEYSKEIAKRMKKSEKEQELIYYAGLLHF